MSRRSRVAIYARYSSDLQNPSSIEDQVFLCTELMKKELGVTRPVGVFTDAAYTGATLNRPGILDLLALAEAGGIDVIVAEGLDRLSRDLADIASIYRTLQCQDVSILTAHEGRISDLHIGFKGTMNAVFLKDLRDKVRRAHRSRLAQGRVPAGLCYGYRVVKGVLDARGNYETGLRMIHPEESAVVLRIFQEFASGTTPNQIARSLNADMIPSPGGKTWRVSAILGAPSRSQGILNNEMYSGWIVYNRSRKVIDPRTGKARHVLKPKDQWDKRFVPELQIIPDSLLEQVQRRRAERRLSPATGKIGHIRGRPINKRPLTSFVVCGECGGEKGIANAGRYVCNVARFQEAKCANNRGTKEENLKNALFEFLFARIDAENRWIEYLVKSLAPRWASYQGVEAEIRGLEERHARLLDAVENGVNPGSTVERIVNLEARLNEFKAIAPPPSVPHSTAEIKGRLKTALNRAESRFFDQKYARQIQRLLEHLIVKIELSPIKSKHHGESLEIFLKPDGWAAFYCDAADLWPDLFEPSCTCLNSARVV